MIIMEVKDAYLGCVIVVVVGLILTLLFWGVGADLIIVYICAIITFGAFVGVCMLKNHT